MSLCRLAALVALAGVVASCAPEYALYPRLRQRKTELGSIEVISVASFVPNGRGVDSLQSRQLAQAVLRQSMEGLARKGYVAANDTGATIRASTTSRRDTTSASPPARASTPPPWWTRAPPASRATPRSPTRSEPPP